ncbi:hypothetical protein C8N35_107182 [Breoghania corrubedonensis]|uniref:Outer membrane beta-barrel protein n=1 Tax=Breoghania corrubedonensis TaxID=665038 RepID=A0A2T5V6T9_9HYPH|nr:outer membrane beta-barrel protein [Breoghania corrubedonensis]PTW59468.1 hypothetical protein C8N35_107182 [Breoghania corrubedonensis]
MIRTALVLCVLASATAAAAQTRDSRTSDSNVLRGSLAAAGDDSRSASARTGASSAGDDLSDDLSLDDPADGAQGTTSQVAVPRGRPVAAVTSEQRIPVGRVRPVQPLAPAEPLTTGSVPRKRNDGATLAGDTERDAPRGIRLGNVLLYPELTVRAGATTNVSGAAGGESGGLVRLAPSLRVTSDWDRHALEVNLRGSFTGYPDAPAGSDGNDVSGTASGLLRLEAGEVTTVEVNGGYALTPESRSNAESTGGSDRTYQHGLTGSLGVTRDAGLVAVTLRGGIDGTIYTGGDEVGNRDNMVASGTLRLAYNLRATVSPFAEATVLGRFYQDGTERNAKGYAVRSGVVFNGGPKLSGEIGVGWRSEDLDGDQYKNLQGVLVDGDLTWSPSRLTSVRLSASTAFEASSLTGASGSLIHSGEISVAHSLTTDVAVAVSGGASYRSYQGIDLTELTYTGGATATYAISDTAALQAQYSYERVDSSLSGQDYDSHTIEAGVRFRR